MFLELSAMYTPKEDNKVYAMSKEGGKLEIPFTQRNNEGVADLVSDFSKLVVDLELDQKTKADRVSLEFRIRNLERKEELTDEDKEKLAEYREAVKPLKANKHEFLTEYDFVNFLNNNLELLKQHKIKATGNILMEESKGKYYTKYVPKRIEVVPADTANELVAKYDIFFDKNALDESDLKESKKIYIDGYVMGYDRKEKADRYFPKQFVINATAIDFENPTHVAYLEMLKRHFNLKSKKTFHHLLWTANLYKGAEVVEFNENMLTAEQKELIAFGLKTIDDFKPKGGVYGDKVEEIRLYTPELVNDYADGAIDTGLKEDEFMELLVKSTADVSTNSVKSNGNEKQQEPTQATTPSVEDQLKALFK